MRGLPRLGTRVQLPDIRSDRRRPMLLVAIAAFNSGAAVAQMKYDTGPSDTEIKIGNMVPYSGPAPAYGIFRMISD